MPNVDSDGLVAWALDGFPILETRDHNGLELSNEDLDARHGRKENVVDDGRTYGYAHHLTRTYPYTAGRSAGNLLHSTLIDVRPGLEPSPRGRRGGRVRGRRGGSSGIR